jgi:hypothetical protein
VLIAAGVLAYLGRIVGRRSPSVDIPATVLQIQQLHELGTVKYRIQKVIGIKEPKIPFGEESLLLVVQGTVVAGIDLNRITSSDVFEIPGGVAVRLPEARILHAYLDENQTRVWDRRITWWTPWVPFSPELETRARQQAVREVEEAARGMGILEQARQNARQSISTLLRTLGIETVHFEPVS